jgi:hypothetical protein
LSHEAEGRGDPTAQPKRRFPIVRLAPRNVFPYPEGDGSAFYPEQEAQLAQIATKEGTDAERLVKDAAWRLLEEDARFRADAPELPILHLGAMGALHRRDIYCRVANKPSPTGNSNQA